MAFVEFFLNIFRKFAEERALQTLVQIVLAAGMSLAVRSLVFQKLGALTVDLGVFSTVFVMRAVVPFADFRWELGMGAVLSILWLAFIVTVRRRLESKADEVIEDMIQQNADALPPSLIPKLLDIGKNTIDPEVNKWRRRNLRSREIFAHLVHYFIRNARPDAINAPEANQIMDDLRTPQGCASRWRWRTAFFFLSIGSLAIPTLFIWKFG